MDSSRSVGISLTMITNKLEALELRGIMLSARNSLNLSYRLRRDGYADPLPDVRKIHFI